MKAIILKADGTAPYVEETPGDLDSIQKYVEGYIESIPSNDDALDERIVVYANEEGLIRRLPFNRNMLAIATLDLVTRRIAGNAIVLGRDGMDETDVPSDIIDAIVGPTAAAPETDEPVQA